MIRAIFMWAFDYSHFWKEFYSAVTVDSVSLLTSPTRYPPQSIPVCILLFTGLLLPVATDQAETLSTTPTLIFYMVD
jgi:hypothetical protein